MSRRKNYLAVLLAGCMMISSVIPASAASKKEVNEKKAEIQNQINKKENQVQSLKTQKNRVLALIKDLDEKNMKAQEKLDSLGTQIEDKNEEIVKNTADLKVAKEDAAQQYADMKTRIQYMYESGNQSLIAAILESGTFAEVLNKAEFFQKMTSFDRDKLNEYKETCTKIENLETKLEKEKSDLEGYKASAEKEKATIEETISQKQSEISGFEAGIDAALAAQADLEGDLAIQNEILSQMKDEVQEAGKPENSKPGNNKPGNSIKPDTGKPDNSKPDTSKPETNKPDTSKPDTNKPDTSKPETNKPDTSKPDTSKPDNSKPDNSGNKEPDKKPGVSLVWPCPSSHRITSPFGDRNAPTAGASSNHKGIDIGAGTGSSIVAAASGTVTTAGYSESAGNHVIISHGNGLHTVYMHASALYVSAGQKVSAGQSIAAVGSTGYSTGPHLHFGVMVNGSYVNPMNYY